MKLLIPFSLLLLFISSSCKKDKTIPDQDSKRNLLVEVVDYQGDTSTSPSFIRRYHYDNQNRLQSEFLFDLAHVYIPEDFPDSFVYFYNGADTLPHMSVHYNAMMGSSNTYYFYDDQGRLIKDSSTSTYDLSNPEVYTYSTNQITFKSDYYFDTATYDGNNITSLIETDTSSGERNVYNIQLSSLKNPYDQINVNRHIPYYVYIGGYGDGEVMLNKNAILSVSFEGSAIPDYNYMYDDVVDGLPGKATISRNSVVDGREYYYYKQ